MNELDSYIANMEKVLRGPINRGDDAFFAKMVEFAIRTAKKHKELLNETKEPEMDRVIPRTRYTGKFTD